MQTAPASLNPAAVNEEHAPVNWVTAIVFTVTPLAALIFVPWYGIRARLQPGRLDRPSC